MINRPRVRLRRYVADVRATDVKAIADQARKEARIRFEDGLVPCDFDCGTFVEPKVGRCPRCLPALPQIKDFRASYGIPRDAGPVLRDSLPDTPSAPAGTRRSDAAPKQRNRRGPSTLRTRRPNPL